MKKLLIILAVLALCAVSFFGGIKFKETTMPYKDSIYVEEAVLSKYNFVISEKENELVVQRCNPDGYLLEETVYVLDAKEEVTEIKVTKQFENAISAINALKELKEDSHLEYTRENNLLIYEEIPSPELTKESVIQQLNKQAEAIKEINIVNKIAE